MLSSLWIWLLPLFILMSCFSTTRISFISAIIFIELLNVFVLIVCFSEGFVVGSFLQFLVFIVVATMEVVISLVSLTRLWCSDIFVY
uniref:NADH dehydrogenase subunit 4L n=1 Tax=Cichlidogyrus halli TaxID=321991 RepID=A0A344ANU1_9PLAT|nr:NADH dehydrogenase subunit 4L [Cichlidogyrus halli]